MTTHRDYTIHPYRLSDSTWDTLDLCERRFQLDRMIANLDRDVAVRQGSPEMVRGSAYGVGVQSYMLHGDMDLALYEAWQAYWPMLENPPKTFEARTLNNLLASREAMDKLREEYEVAIFNDKPAIELSFRLNLDDKWYYVGYIDIVLLHRKEKFYAVFECKTTGFNHTDLTPLYRYSGQALGYSIILDQIAGAEQTDFTTLYFVCRDHPKNFIPDIYTFPFKKTLLDRFKWFMTLGMDLNHLNSMMELDMFPLRKKGCVSYGRVCPHFGFCHMTAGDKPRAIPEDTNTYQFVYNLQDVIEDHVKRIG